MKQAVRVFKLFMIVGGTITQPMAKKNSYKPSSGAGVVWMS